MTPDEEQPMHDTWGPAAAGLLDRAGTDWAGVWSLLFATGKATFRLSLQVPLTTGAALAFAAMDLREARDEVEWTHPDLPSLAPAVDLGPLGPVVDEAHARSVLHELTGSLLAHLDRLEEAPHDEELLRRVASKVRAAHDELARTPR